MVNRLSPSDAWDFVKILLKQEMHLGDFNKFISPVIFKSFVDRIFELTTGNADHIDWLTDRMTSSIESQLAGLFNSKVEVNFIFQERNEADTNISKGEVVPVVKDLKGNERKVKLRQAYGDKRGAIIQPEKTIFLTHYFFAQWKPLLPPTCADVIIACRLLCYWNPLTYELRNVIQTTYSRIAELAGCGTRSVERAIINPYVNRYFLKTKTIKAITAGGMRNIGSHICVRMDDPLTPKDQLQHDLIDVPWWPDEFETNEVD